MKHPGYLYSDGFFLLSDVAPIVEMTDIPPSAPAQKIFESVALPLHEPIYREAHLFSPGGLAWAIRKHVPDEYIADDIAMKTALHAIGSHPLGFLALGAKTWAGYFYPRFLSIWLTRDEGGLRPQDDAFREEVRKVFGIDLQAGRLDGPVSRWHELAIPWCWLLVTAPFVLPVFLVGARRRNRSITAYLCFSLLLMLGIASVITQHVEPRYLIPVAWLVFVAGPAVIFLRKSGAPTPAPALPD
jgi:hypothetical protein